MANRMNRVLAMVCSLLTPDYRNNNSKLEERVVGMSVPIYSDSLTYLSYSFDKELPVKYYPKGLYPFLMKNKDVHSMCDYMLFCYYNNKLYVLLVELKRGKKNVKTQLNAGKCLAKFIVDTLNRIEKISVSAEIRLISIRNNHIINKRPTKIREIEYDNEKFCTFGGCYFHLKEFLK